MNAPSPTSLKARIETAIWNFKQYPDGEQSGATELDYLIAELQHSRPQPRELTEALLEVFQSSEQEPELVWVGLYTICVALPTEPPLASYLMNVTRRNLPQDIAARAWAHRIRMHLGKPATFDEFESDPDLITAKAEVVYDVLLRTTTAAGAIQIGTRWISEGLLDAYDLINRTGTIESLMSHVNPQTGRTFFLDACESFFAAIPSPTQRAEFAAHLDNLYGLGIGAQVTFGTIVDLMYSTQNDPPPFFEIARALERVPVEPMRPRPQPILQDPSIRNVLALVRSSSARSSSGLG